MYRFRTVDNLLGKYKELENQEIYFASPEELNDPMEGYKELFWKGDAIVWKNFLINYTKSLEHIFLLHIISPKDSLIKEENILVGRELMDNKTPHSTEIIPKILELLFNSKFISELPNWLSQRRVPIRKAELLLHLQMIHPFVINAISKVYFDNGFTNNLLYNRDLSGFEKMMEDKGSFAELLNKMEVENNNKDSEEFFIAINHYTQSLFLQNRFDNPQINDNHNALFLLAEFSDKFIAKLEIEIYPPWYSASFLSHCDNSAVWGHYGNSHKGVCLNFKTIKNKNDDEILNLETEYGYSDKPIIGMKPHKFRKIQYGNSFTEIDFFKSIGRLNRIELNHLWYKDSLGNFSECGKHINEKEQEDEWRNQYWNNFYNSISTKLTEWDYENEYRLIINGDFVDYSDKNNRKLKYDFNDLESITFGIKTQESDKLKIIDIIKKKCIQNNRDDFEFYQAYYSKEKRKVETYKLDLL